MKPKLRYLETLVLFLILYSIITHFIELEFTDSEHSTGFFLWSEHVVAALFTIEYFARWVVSRSASYPFRLMALMDLAAILPFYIGFLVDLRSLRLIRVLRIFRLFKLYRYTDALRNILNAFHRVRYEFCIVGFAALTIGWIGSVLIFELEREQQPEVFGRLSDAFWFTITTLSTVGYGDKVPVTPVGRMVAVLMMVLGLGLFGTFVSLVGSAFLEEIRKVADRKREGDSAAGAPALPGLARMTQADFAPDQVLQAINEGVLSHEKVAGNAEAIRLLTLACHIILSERFAPGGTPKEKSRMAN